MLDHLGIQVADVEASLAFYLRVFAPIGVREMMRLPHGEGFVVGLSGPDGVPSFWLSAADGSDETRELHVGFRAQDRSAVDAVHDAALSAGVEFLHSPRECPSTTPATTACSCATLTATTLRPSTTGTETGLRPPDPRRPGGG